MPHSELHKKKKKKNLMVFGLVLLWCALIWMVTMIKMANADEGIMLETRFQHQEKSGDVVQKWADDYQNGEEKRQKTLETANDLRAKQRDNIVNTQDGWLENWYDAEDKRLKTNDELYHSRAAHYDKVLPRQQEWHDDWEQRRQEKHEQKKREQSPQ